MLEKYDLVIYCKGISKHAVSPSHASNLRHVCHVLVVVYFANFILFVLNWHTTKESITSPNYVTNEQIRE